MLEAGMGRTRPDARDKAELLDTFEADERGRVEQGDLAPPEEDAVIQAITDRGQALGSAPPARAIVSEIQRWFLSRVAVTTATCRWCPQCPLTPMRQPLKQVA